MTKTIQATCKSAKLLKLCAFVCVVVGVGGMAQKASFEFVRNAFVAAFVLGGLGSVIGWWRNG